MWLPLFQSEPRGPRALALGRRRNRGHGATRDQIADGRFGVFSTTEEAPQGMPDREVTYPVTFVNFDEMLGTLSRYEVVLSMALPSSNYEFRGQLVQGASLIFRSKSMCQRVIVAMRPLTAPT
jgi:hypothetical protein